MHDPDFKRTAETPGILTQRELEILRLRAAGRTWTDISLALNIAPGTIGSAIKRAERKIHAAMEEPAT